MKRKINQHRNRRLRWPSFDSELSVTNWLFYFVFGTKLNFACAIKLVGIYSVFCGVLTDQFSSFVSTATAAVCTKNNKIKALKKCFCLNIPCFAQAVMICNNASHSAELKKP